MTERKHLGLEYQDLIAARAMVGVIAGDWDTVACERKRTAGDKFDDVWMAREDETVQFQMKHGYAAGELEQWWLNEPGGRGLSLAGLAHSWRELQEVGPPHRIIVITPLEPPASLEEYLEAASDLTVLGLSEVQTVHLTPEILDELEEARTALDEAGFDSGEVSEFLGALEFAFRVPGIDWEDPDDPTTLEQQESFQLIERYVDERLPMGRNPGLRSTEQVVRRLRECAQECRQKTARWDRERLLDRLAITLDEYRLNETFTPVEAPVTIGWVETLPGLVSDSANRTLVVRGGPGAGKSHGLYSFAEVWRGTNPRVPLIEHYCHLPGSNLSPDRRRIRLVDVARELVAAAREAFPSLFNQPDDDIPRTDLPGLQSDLNRIGEWAEGEGITVPILIDGLDHAPRAKERDETLAPADATVVDLLEALVVPPGVCLVVGTQPGEHLGTLEGQSATYIYDVPPWEPPEIQAYLARHGFKIEEEASLLAIQEATNGIPLLLAYLCRETEGAQVEEFLQAIEGPLPTADDLDSYYEWILSERGGAETIALHTLAAAEFPLSEMELAAILDPSTRAYRDIDDLLTPFLHTLERGEYGFGFFHESFRIHLLGSLDSHPQRHRDVISWLRDFLYRGWPTDPRSATHLVRYIHMDEGPGAALEFLSPERLDEAYQALWPVERSDQLLLAGIEAAAEEEDHARLMQLATYRGYHVERTEYLRPEALLRRRIDDIGDDNLYRILSEHCRRNASIGECVQMLCIAVERGRDVSLAGPLAILRRRLTQRVRDDSPSDLDFYDYLTVLAAAGEWQLLWELVRGNEEDGNYVSRRGTGRAFERAQAFPSLQDVPEWVRGDPALLGGALLSHIRAGRQELAERVSAELEGRVREVPLDVLKRVLEHGDPTNVLDEINHGWDYEPVGPRLGLQAEEEERFQRRLARPLHQAALHTALGFPLDTLHGGIEDDATGAIQPVLKLAAATGELWALQRDGAAEAEHYQRVYNAYAECRLYTDPPDPDIRAMSLWTLRKPVRKVLGEAAHLLTAQDAPVGFRRALIEELEGPAGSTAYQLARTSMLEVVARPDLSSTEDTVLRRTLESLEALEPTMEIHEVYHGTSRVWRKLGEAEIAESRLKSAARWTFRYGAHKDMLLDDVWAGLIALEKKGVSVPSSLKVRMVNWAHLMLEFTNKDHTRYFEGRFLSNLLADRPDLVEAALDTYPHVLTTISLLSLRVDQTSLEEQEDLSKWLARLHAASDRDDWCTSAHLSTAERAVANGTEDLVHDLLEHVQVHHGDVISRNDRYLFNRYNRLAESTPLDELSWDGSEDLPEPDVPSMGSLDELTEWLRNVDSSPSTSTAFAREVLSELGDADLDALERFLEALMLGRFSPHPAIVEPVLRRLGEVGGEALAGRFAGWVLREKGGWRRYWGVGGEQAIDGLAQVAPQRLEYELLDGFASMCSAEHWQSNRTQGRYLRALAEIQPEESESVMYQLEAVLERLLLPFSDVVDRWNWLGDRLDGG